MKNEIIVVGEGNMINGRDLIHYWVSPEDVFKSGRLDFLKDNEDVESQELYESLKKCKSVKEIIDIMCDIFYIID